MSRLQGGEDSRKSLGLPVQRFCITADRHKLSWNPGISVASPYKPDMGPTPQNVMAACNRNSLRAFSIGPSLLCRDLKYRPLFVGGVYQRFYNGFCTDSKLRGPDKEA